MTRKSMAAVSHLGDCLIRPAAIAVALVGTACHGQPPTSPATTSAALSEAELETLRARPDVKALMDKTLKNLRFVEGGSFEMGDFGERYGDEGLPFDRNADSKPLHKVTLTSFSISAFKKREPDLPKINILSGMSDSTASFTRDTTARCVANRSTPVTR